MWHRGTVALILSALLTIALTGSLQGCGCGFDCSSDDDETLTGTLTLGFSDAPLDDATEVVLVVDAITLQGNNIADVVIETFTIDELGLQEAETFRIDLLSFPGLQQLLVLSNLELTTGNYSAIVLELLDGDVNQSYVMDLQGQKVLNAPASQLTVPGLSISAGSQAYTVEFALGQSLLYAVSADNYELTNEGIQVIDNDVATTIDGTVDPGLFNLEEPCLSKTNPQQGNRVYLYSGTGHTAANLTDVYTSASATTVPDGAIAPFKTTRVLENSTFGRWEYIFAFVPAGDYTLVFSCHAEDDDPVDYDGIILPFPTDQIYELTVSAGTASTCNLATGASCS